MASTHVREKEKKVDISIFLNKTNNMGGGGGWSSEFRAPLVSSERQAVRPSLFWGEKSYVSRSVD